MKYINYFVIFKIARVNTDLGKIWTFDKCY